MFRKLSVAVAILVLGFAGSAVAQSRGQVTVFGGWTLSDGVTGDAVRAGDGNTYNAIDVKDGANWGLMFGVNATPNVEVGFLFGQQFSKLALEGTANRELGDMTVSTYQPYFAFNMGDHDAKARPYVMVGIGATSYGNVDYTKANGQPGSTGSVTKFSWSVGAGVKVYPSPRVGLHVGMHWTPTYIKSDATGWWCDPYWGCYVVGDAQYSNQLQFNGGVTFRF
jgi:outer membrane protein W